MQAVKHQLPNLHTQCTANRVACQVWLTSQQQPQRHGSVSSKHRCAQFAALLRCESCSARLRHSRLSPWPAALNGADPQA
jgi:hypothetical protein